MAVPLAPDTRICTVKDSEPSMSASEAANPVRAIGVSSWPVTFCTVSVGASATAVKLRVSVVLASAVWPPSAAVTVTLSV